jgi:hypothetical protein
VLFGYGVVLAIEYLIEPWPFPVYTTAAKALHAFAIGDLPGIAAAIALYLFACRQLGQRPAEVTVTWAGPSPLRERAIIILTGVCAAAILAFNLWTALVTPHKHPWVDPELTRHPQPVMVLSGVLTGVSAAIREELAVLAVPAMLLRAAGVNPQARGGVAGRPTQLPPVLRLGQPEAACGTSAPRRAQPQPH